MSLETSSGTTQCSKGHTHPAWNTTGVLRIAKCESVCGFCQKETKTAANLRKHVAIHIKNEGLSLTIAEGSSGRGRLEMPIVKLDQETSSSSSLSRISSISSDRNMTEGEQTSPILLSSRRPPITLKNEYFSPSGTLMAMYQSSLYGPQQAGSVSPRTTFASPSTTPSVPSSTHYAYGPTSTLPSLPSTHAHAHAQQQQQQQQPQHHPQHYLPTPSDPFRRLRDNNITTKPAWTVIPSHEGFRILDLCKSLSITQSSASNNGPVPPPCYNRETIFDEEWQAHMKDVHGVFLIWPETWMRRIEVLDLDAFGGDIGVCNEVVMDVHHG